MRRRAWFVLLLLSAALPAHAQAQARAPSIDLAAHRAVYKLTLASTRGGVTGAGGTMAFEMSDACEGWATRQRLRITASTDGGRNIEIGSDYSTPESKDGRSLRFNVRQTTEEAVSSEAEGRATLSASGGSGQAVYTVPEDMTKPLPNGTLLPNAHTIAILEAARAGKKFVAVPLFDGSSAKGAQDTSVVIFGWDPPKESAFPVLSKLRSARMHIAFFEHEKGASTPGYELGIRYFENGIADNITMDFGDFVMKASLQELSVLPKAC